jgi:purine-nucleoside phosphorylase
MPEAPSLPSHDLATRVRDAVAFVRSRVTHVPRVGITLGSGLGGVLDTLVDPTVFPTTAIPHWPRSTVMGHAGRFAIGTWRGVPVAALAGRSHRYEGYSLDRVTFAVRVMHGLGARTLLFTNAVGAIHPELRPRDLVLATSHINFIGKRGLLTPAEVVERRESRATATPYDPGLRADLIAAAARARVTLRRGVLMGGQGPSYETAAEVRMAARFGADLACMSTVHEVLVGAELGCACASISCVTNRATGLSAHPLTHEEVTEIADHAAGKIRVIFEEYLTALAAGV